MTGYSNRSKQDSTSSSIKNHILKENILDEITDLVNDETNSGNSNNIPPKSLKNGFKVEGRRTKRRKTKLFGAKVEVSHTIKLFKDGNSENGAKHNLISGLHDYEPNEEVNLEFKKNSRVKNSKDGNAIRGSTETTETVSKKRDVKQVNKASENTSLAGLSENTLKLIKAIQNSHKKEYCLTEIKEDQNEAEFGSNQKQKI